MQTTRRLRRLTLRETGAYADERAEEVSSVKQTRIRRSSRVRGGRGEPVPDLLPPTSPASDTSAARTVVARIDAALAAR